MYLIRYNFQIKPLSLYHINKETAATYNSGINKMTTSNATALPTIQKDFINSFDGSLKSAISFPLINLVLNPTFSCHYFYVSGTNDNNTITTKDTDGSFAYWGNQTELEMHNASILAVELKEWILSFNPKPLEEIVDYNHDKMRSYAKKISTVRRRAAFIIDNEIVLVPGLKL